VTIHVRRLRLDGVQRKYGLSFLDSSGQVQGLSIIAGEILTGKTSVLDFIAYCLGAREYPQHPEIRQNVGTALLEVQLDDVVYVIERSCVEHPSSTALVHSCELEAIEGPHPTEELLINPPGDERSLSSFLLRNLGVAGVSLREAPTQSASGADPLSIRDLLRLVYVRFLDLGGENLLLEKQTPVVRLKHEQVIDLLFNAHDNRAVSLASALRDLRKEIEKRQAALDTIVAFLVEQRVPGANGLREQLQSVEQEVVQAENLLQQLEEQMEAVAEFGDQQREAHQRASVRANAASNERRSAASQIERLTALAAQYDQDVKKLTFAQEASLLFDPLMISVCPWCLQGVGALEVEAATCPVCHQALSDDVDDLDGRVNLDKELRAVKQRQKELGGLLDELHESARAAEAEQGAALVQARESQRALDQAMRSRFAPFIDQRDALVASVAASRQDHEQIQRYLSMQEGADRRRAELGLLRQREAELLREQADAESTRRTRVDAADQISQRFTEILTSFRFPKLSDSFVDSRYVPHVRNLSYNKLGSAGAGTLVSLAWYLAVFELSVEHGAPHPGVLLIDSPQKGLLARPDIQADEFQSTSIAASVYQHLITWSSGELGRGGQIIVVDNAPQPIAEQAVVVRYTGDADDPPYGLIDDAVS
jgi:hypothetical protein